MSLEDLPATETKGVMSQEHFKMLFPDFTVACTGGAVQYDEHNYTIEGSILNVFKVPKESWLRPKLVAIFKDWTLVQIHAE